MLFIKHYLDSFTLSLSQVKTTHAWQHLAANILEVFAEGCEESNTAVFCSLTAVIWFQTSPARTATLKSIWTMTTRTEQTSQQRRNRLPLALTDHVAQIYYRPKMDLLLGTPQFTHAGEFLSACCTVNWANQ